MKIWQWCWGLLPLVQASPEQTKDAYLNWFHQQGGTFHTLQDIRLEEPEKGENSRFVAFANDNIPKGQILAHIPWDLIASPHDYNAVSYQEQDDFDCETAEVWAEEIMNNPKFSSYVQHLQSQPERFNPPSWYSLKGQDLFLRILGGQDHSYNYVDFAATLPDSWAANCDWDEPNNDIGEAVKLVSKFSYQGLMIPLHDMYVHRSGHYHNTKVTIVDGQFVKIEARRDIEVGEQLYSTYDEHAEYLKDPAEILRDRGMIPQYPHHWNIPTAVMTIPLDDDEEDDQQFMGHNTDLLVFNVTRDVVTGEFEPIVFNDKDSIHFHYRHGRALRKIQDLNHLKNIELQGMEEYDIPQHEWDTLMEFLDIFLDAWNRVFDHAHELVTSTTAMFPKKPNCNEEETCKVNWDHHYHLFEPRFDVTAYNNADCLSSEFSEIPFTYDTFAIEKSNYQELEWRYREEDDDTCLHLDDMLQICSGYRPHYHEFFVHYAARYVPSVKRVIFLGSGDAMLLHEILKYPDLEKVVGLELDQHVTRKSFKHFKTQPHYDDPRVEWWYGDATKTLPLLPRDYWGSFDLLLVDLSETVVSLHVTGDHDVLDVISNLLKPEGVMFENELYLQAMSSHFDHTVQIFYGSPKVCTQVQTVSSNKVDFLTSPIYDHGVHTFLIDEVKDPWDRFRYIHDYKKTDGREFDQCNGSDNDDSTEHGRKAGIFVVLEAEDVSINLDHTLEEVVHSVIRTTGLTPVSGGTQTTSGTIQVVMKEGYVVARPWPELKYVAFDISLWGAYDKTEDLRSALSEAVGSESTSSFRVVVGGMHGSSTWEDDQNGIGVQFSESRDCTITDLKDMEVDEDTTLQAIFHESINLLDGEDFNILVVCGPEQQGADCASIQRAQKHAEVAEVIPIWACDGIPEFNDGSEEFASMIECEKKLIADLIEHSERVGEFDMIVIDFNAPSAMLQLFGSILGYDKVREEVMEPGYLVSVPFRDGNFARWAFLDILRTTIRDGFIAQAELSFEGDQNDYLGLGILLHGNDKAVYSFSGLEDALTRRLPKTNVELHGILSGQGHPQRDMELEERSFRPEDYDMEPNRKQFQEQRPLGRQTIIQLELSSDSVTMPSLEELAAAVEVSLQSINVREVEDMRTVRDVGDGGVALSRFESGNIVLTWDGEDHVDINLFIVDQEKTIVDSFLAKFLEQTQGQLSRTLRDDHPRGIGRVVNFQSDIGGEASR